MLEHITEIIKDIFETEDEITEDTSFDEDLAADFMDMQELFMIIEEEFDILTDDEDIDNISTVGDLIKYIEENVEKQA